MELPLLKLSCANCAAPLDITDDLDTFACAYCGTNQRVERNGGAVSLRKVESAIKAVQRGTDRTAAELALPRLAAELSDMKRRRVDALGAAKEDRDKVVRGRRKMAAIIFSAMIFGVMFIATTSFDLTGSNTVAQVMTWGWLGLSMAVPVWVFRRIKVPADNSALIGAPFDEQISRIEEHIRANRAILNEPPN